MNKLITAAFIATSLLVAPVSQASDLNISFEAPGHDTLTQSWTLQNIEEGSKMKKQVERPNGTPLEIAIKVEKIDGDQVVTNAKIYEVKDALFGRTRLVLLSEQDISSNLGDGTSMLFRLGGNHDIASSFRLKLAPMDGAVASN